MLEKDFRACDSLLAGGDFTSVNLNHQKWANPQCLWQPGRDGQVMDVRVVDTAGDNLPRIASFLAVTDAVHFDAGPNVLGVYRVDGKGTDGELVHGRVQPLPVLSCILCMVCTMSLAPAIRGTTCPPLTSSIGVLGPG